MIARRAEPRTRAQVSCKAGLGVGFYVRTEVFHHACLALRVKSTERLIVRRRGSKERQQGIPSPQTFEPQKANVPQLTQHTVDGTRGRARFALASIGRKL